MSPAEYLVVEYDPRPTDGTAPPAAVTSSASFRWARASLKTATIRPTDSCFEDATSFLGPKYLALRSDCSVFVNELEVALLDAGFQMVDWTKLVDLEREKNIPAPAAADQLHADVVIVLDRFALEEIEDREHTGRRFRYFRGDARGSTFGEQLVGAETRDDIEKFILDLVGGREGPPDARAISLKIGATAVIPSTGEPIWQYGRAVTKPIGDAKAVRFLFGRRDAGPWHSIEPSQENDGAAIPHPVVSASVIRGLPAPSWLGGPAGPPRSRDDITRLMFMRAGAIDFVRAFSGGS